MISFIPKPLKKWLAIFRGKVSPLMITLSVALGFWFGLTPGWGGLHVALLLAALIINLHIGIFLLMAGIGKAVCLGATPVLYYTGLAVFNHFPALVRLLRAIPVVAMTDYSRIAVTGAALIGPVLGLSAGLALAKAVIVFRKTWLAFEADHEMFQCWYNKKWVVLLDKLLIGKSARDPKKILQGTGPVFRKAGLAVAGVVVLASVAASLMISDESVRLSAERQLTRANGAEVNIDAARFATLSGLVHIEGLHMTDAKNPERNRIQVDEFKAKVSILQLLLGRFVMREVVIGRIDLDTPRETPGEIYSRPEREPAPPPPERTITGADVERYLQQASTIKETLQKIARFLPSEKRDPKKEPPAQPAEPPEHYLEYLQAVLNQPVGARYLFREVVIAGVHTGWDMLGKSAITLLNLNSAPVQEGRPLTLRLVSEETTSSIEITYDFSAGPGTPNVSGSFEGFPLEKLGSSAILFEQGTASGRLTGDMLANELDITLECALNDFQVDPRGPGLFGLDGKTTAEILETMESIQLAVHLTGSPANPRISLDNQLLIEQVREAATRMGRDRVLQRVDAEISERADDLLPTETREGITEGIRDRFRR